MKLKKVIALIAAAAAVMSVSATVLAADYPSTSTGTVVGTPTYGDGTSASAPTQVVTTTMVTAKKDPVVYVAKASTVSAAVMGGIKAGQTVTFKGPDYQIVFDAPVTKATNIALGVTNESKASEDVWTGFFKEPVAAIKMEQKGEFGTTAKITASPKDITKKIDVTKKIYVFSYNRATNSYKFMGEATVNKNGSVTFPATRGYEILLSNARTFTLK